MSPIVETDRLVLRRFAEADAPLLLALDGDPEVMRFVGRYGLANVAAYRERIHNYFLPYYAKGSDFGFWPAEEKATGTFIGWFHLRSALDYRFAAEAGFRNGEFDIGFRLVRSAWGQGYATEVTRALVQRGFGHPDVEAIVACALAENVASCRVLEKAGLRRVGEFALPGFDTRAAKYLIAKPQAANL